MVLSENSNTTLWNTKCGGEEVTSTIYIARNNTFSLHLLNWCSLTSAFLYAQEVLDNGYKKDYCEHFTYFFTIWICHDKEIYIWRFTFIVISLTLELNFCIYSRSYEHILCSTYFASLKEETRQHVTRKWPAFFHQKHWRKEAW